MSNQFTLDHIKHKNNNIFYIIKYIRFIYDIYELLKNCKNCGTLISVAPTGWGSSCWALVSKFCSWYSS